MCMLFCYLLFFFQTSSGIPSVSNSLDPDQVRRFSGPDQEQNCLQKLSADDNLSKKPFTKKKKSKKIRNTISVNPDQVQRYVGSDLAPKCLQKLSADDTSRECVKPQ